MALAYTASLRSSCFRRQVGAVIVGPRGDVLAIGYNENPVSIGSCLDRYGECYKDVYKRGLFDQIKTLVKSLSCPKCGKEINELTPGLRCPNQACRFDIDQFLVPDRAMSRCTALHAEARAIMSVDPARLAGSSLYSTTFPCFSCAQKIVHVGIREITYSEPYADSDAVRLINDAKQNGKKIETFWFEGVTARLYGRLFPSWRPKQEKNN